MQQFCTYGSVREAAGNRRPYRDPLVTLAVCLVVPLIPIRLRQA